MTELLFPVVGGLIIFFVAVPVLSMVSRAFWSWLPNGSSSIDHHGQAWSLAAIVGPVLVPVVWMLSAAIHQVEAGAPITACVIDHLGGELCRDIILFGLVLVVVLGAGIGRHLLAAVPMLQAPALTHLVGPIQRVSSLCAGHPVLKAHRDRIQVVDEGCGPVYTRGLIWPKVEVEANILANLSDEELVAALLHEIAHVHARDPLRQFLAHVALSLNPLRRLLEPEFARYRFAREALCDRRAVQMGACPLALAQSIVRVAGSRPSVLTSGLGGTSMAGVRVRVQLLLDYASHTPDFTSSPAPWFLLPFCLVILIVQPHMLGTGPLDLLHSGVENAALFLGLH